MGLRFNVGCKVLIGSLGLSLVGCGGAALEGEDTLARATQRVDGAVTVTLNGDAEMNLECRVDTWTDPGATATDGAGNPLTVETFNSGNDPYGPGPNPGAEGSYSVQYQAIDANGNVGSAVRTVNVRDTLAPTLTLIGEAEVTHLCGSQWVDPGYTASDVCYQDLTPAVVFTGEVNGWIEGTYTVLYEVRDGAGLTAPALTRTVHVVNCPVSE